MITCDELRASSFALAALHDEEAFAHAADCAGCAAALREGTLVLGAFDELRHTPPASPEALAHARAAVLVRLEQETALEPAWRRALVPAQIVALFLVSVLHRQEGFPAASWAQGLLLLAAAAAFSVLVATRGVASVAGSVATAALAGAALGSAGAVHADHGVHCMVIELVAAAIPLATTAVLFSARSVRRIALPAVAAAGALGGQAALVMICPYRTYGHLLAFHLGAVLLAAAIGLALGRALELKTARD